MQHLTMEQTNSIKNKELVAALEQMYTCKDPAVVMDHAKWIIDNGHLPACSLHLEPEQYTAIYEVAGYSKEEAEKLCYKQGVANWERSKFP